MWVRNPEAGDANYRPFHLDQRLASTPSKSEQRNARRCDQDPHRGASVENAANRGLIDFIAQHLGIAKRCGADPTGATSLPALTPAQLAQRRAA